MYPRQLQKNSLVLQKNIIIKCDDIDIQLHQ